MSIVTAALCAPEPAWANDVTVTIMGAVDSGFDTTGVFGEPTAHLTGNFTLVYVLDDMNGQSCGFNYSCIKQFVTNPIPYPMTEIMLKVNNGAFRFSNFLPATITQEASRQLHYMNHDAYLAFAESERVPAPAKGQPPAPYGSGDLHANLYVDEALSACWEGAIMPPYTLKTGDSPPSNSLTNFFDINFFEVEDNVAKQKYVARGNLTMQKIAIMSGPNQPPADLCFIHHYPR